MDKFKRKQRRFVTLIEMMIVMFLIALITGVVAYNYQGSLEKGKVFKTEAGIEKLQSILSLALADNPDADLSGEGWQEIVRQSPLVKDSDALIRDGWGQPYEVSVDPSTHQITIMSRRLESYQNQRQ